jgi:hypothetical protein
MHLLVYGKVIDMVEAVLEDYLDSECSFPYFRKVVQAWINMCSTSNLSAGEEVKWMKFIGLLSQVSSTWALEISA